MHARGCAGEGWLGAQQPCAGVNSEGMDADADETLEPVRENGGDSTGGGGGGSGGGGNHRSRRPDPHDDGDDSSDHDDLNEFMRSRAFSWDKIPADVSNAFRAGLITAAVVKNYVYGACNPLSRFLMEHTWRGMRERFLADNLFLTKILIEEGLGICGKLSAEYEVRRGRFFDEIDFVFANLLMALLADFALVYFPAPSVNMAVLRGAKRSAGAAASSSSWRQALSKWTRNMPSNVFQVDRAYTMQQRAACYFYKVAQLFTVGAACAAIGVALTNTIITARQWLDPGFAPRNPKSDIVFTSLMYGVFLGISSGTRYQLVNGIEIHLFPRLLGKAPRLATGIATYLLRWGNTFWGSQQWAMWAMFTGAQKSGNAKAE
ncbi:hypothetical protein CDCA_CDCA10G2866 [Cyanidium caldarium]|uniref:Uncharacterized protein n=1 Tax=Cyanidium caldarium TaxID=2771 RepID=A0AAV9IXG7_CYACA|nr:hypothetical protein CDCA_CDCA10G2866 [Cyanidium caldarium]